MYWCCAQVEPRRERLASYTLGLAGYEIYQPLLREQRRSRHGRKIIVTPPLFPGYLFLWVVSGWWNARWSAGVRRLVMDGPVPARVPEAGGIWLLSPPPTLRERGHACLARRLV